MLLDADVTFDGGKVRSFADDPRLVLSVTPADCAGATLSPATVFLLPAAACDEVTVFVHLPGLTEPAGATTAPPRVTSHAAPLRRFASTPPN